MDKLYNLIGPTRAETITCVESCVVDNNKKFITEKVTLHLQNDRIHAYLLIPHEVLHNGVVVYAHHQHDGNWSIGKSEVVGLCGDPDQAIGRELAEQGFIVFAPDAVGFEERNTRGGWRCAYFQLATRVINGSSLLPKLLNDILTCNDYIYSRKDFSVERIVFIGHSYGGKMALFAPVVDKRIVVSVSNCGCARFSDMNNPNVGIMMEFCVPGVINNLEIDDVVRHVSPCSLLISATDNDVWSQSATKIFESVKDAFSDDRIKLRLYSAGHVFTPEMRENAYNFIRTELSRSH